MKLIQGSVPVSTLPPFACNSQAVEALIDVPLIDVHHFKIYEKAV